MSEHLNEGSSWSKAELKGACDSMRSLGLNYVCPRTVKNGPVKVAHNSKMRLLCLHYGYECLRIAKKRASWRVRVCVRACVRACVCVCVCVLELIRKMLDEVMKCVYLISRVDYVLLVVYIFC